MTETKKPRRGRTAKRTPEADWPWPQTGGSWTRDPETGALTPGGETDADTEEPKDGAEEV